MKSHSNNPIEILNSAKLMTLSNNKTYDFIPIESIAQLILSNGLSKYSANISFLLVENFVN